MFVAMNEAYHFCLNGFSGLNSVLLSFRNVAPKTMSIASWIADSLGSSLECKFVG